MFALCAKIYLNDWLNYTSRKSRIIKKTVKKVNLTLDPYKLEKEPNYRL